LLYVLPNSLEAVCVSEWQNPHVHSVRTSDLDVGIHGEWEAHSEQETVHGGWGVHYELHDVASGRSYQ
jgi:hypothetical protein